MGFLLLFQGFVEIANLHPFKGSKTIQFPNLCPANLTLSTVSRRLFDTYHAEPEEIEGLKAALDEAGIAWFETHKGFWGAGSAGIWVKSDEDYAPGREVVDEFQTVWRQHVRAMPVKKGIYWSRLPVLIVIGGLLLYFNLYWFFLD